uniref:LOG family protein n=1 Tax=Eiseniibacteriota bacterium TaxID=2212470 RepID=A0A832I1N5_UNCEI
MHVPSRRPLVAVYGSSTVREGDRAYADALALGRALGAAGADVVTGGYGGVMEAASRGAHEAGAHVVGVTVELFERRGPVNPWVRERVHTPDLFERLRHITSRADGFVVAHGSVGTLTELFLTWNLLVADGRPQAPLVAFGAAWPALLRAARQPELVPDELFRYVREAATPEEAARLALGAAAPGS